MARLSMRHRDLQRRLHRAEYGISGWRWALPVMRLAGRVDATSVLDYGAGKGTLESVISREIDTRQYDPVTFPAEPEPADLVVCTDVLENVEPECLGEVLGHIQGLALKAVFIVVAIHDEKKDRDGLVIAEAGWWLSRLVKVWPENEHRIIPGRESQRVQFEGLV